MATDDRADLLPEVAPEDTDAAADSRAADALGGAAVELTAQLVAIDSVNPGLVPGAAGEDAIVEHLRARLAHNGFHTQVVHAVGRAHRPSLVAIGPTASPGPTIVLSGHVDTVGVAGMAAPFEPVVTTDRLTGRGACDMKGGLAAMVVAAEDLAARRMPGRVVLALVADEEDASLGAEAVLSALPGLGVRPDVAVVGEPTWLAVTESLRGYALVEVVLAGRPAHSSQPELGVNAVAHLGRLLTAVEERSARLARSGGSLMVTVASGGESPFVLAGSARAMIERRTVPGERSDAALGEVEELIARLRAVDGSMDATARLVLAREPWRLDADGPAASLAAELEQSLVAGTGHDVPQRLAAPYWMEAPLWQAAGIPALVCGPAGGGLHAPDEWVDLHQVRRYATALTSSIENWAAARAH